MAQDLEDRVFESARLQSRFKRPGHVMMALALSKGPLAHDPSGLEAQTNVEAAEYVASMSS